MTTLRIFRSLPRYTIGVKHDPVFVIIDGIDDTKGGILPVFNTDQIRIIAYGVQQNRKAPANKNEWTFYVLIPTQTRTNKDKKLIKKLNFTKSI